MDIIRPPTGAHHPQIHLAILSSLAKDILLQAEIETTAEKNSAGPLAQVTFNILSTVGDFADVFFAKLVQRIGGWPIPAVIPNKDFDNRPWTDRDEKLKVMGYRKSGDSDNFESEAEFTSRAAGIMRIYFSILKIVPTQNPLQPMFQLPRYWTWFARLLDERILLETAVAAQLMYSQCHISFLYISWTLNVLSIAALDVMGHDALQIWGAQWVKMLALIYEGVTVGIGADKFIGGVSPEGKAARVRVQLEIERIMTP